MPEANVLYTVTAVVVAGLVVWVAAVLKTAKEPWARAAPAPSTAAEGPASSPGATPAGEGDEKKDEIEAAATKDAAPVSKDDPVKADDAKKDEPKADESKKDADKDADKDAKNDESAADSETEDKEKGKEPS
jgi:hypothetical protein